MRLLVLFFVVTSFCYSQSKENGPAGRYQIIEVAKIEEEQSRSGIINAQTATAKKTVLLIDSFTGKSWALIPVIYFSKNDTLGMVEYEWKPIKFSGSGNWTKSDFLPPK